MNTLRTILAASALLSLAAGLLLCTETAVDEKALLRELAPDEAFSDKTGTPPHYRSDRGAAAFSSSEVAPPVRGYAGPITALVVLGSDGRIRGLRILSHRETKNYVHYMETPAYLSRFVGKSVLDRFEIDKDLDGISRATVSVEALAATVRDSSRAVAARVYGIAVPAGGPPGNAGRGWLWYGLLFLAAFAGYFVTRRDRRLLRLRDASLAASTVVIGLYLASPFSIIHVFNLLLLRPSSSALWLVIVISTLLSVAIAGRFYCGWLCPFGALAELIGRIPVRKWVLPARADGRWRKLKYIVLAVAVTAVGIGRKADYGNYEAYITLFSHHGSALAWALVGLSLAANVRVRRFWCRYLCPVAALTGVLARRDPAYVSAADCPMGNGPYPETAECIRCNRCYTQPARTAPAGMK